MIVEIRPARPPTTSRSRSGMCSLMPRVSAAPVELLLAKGNEGVVSQRTNRRLSPRGSGGTADAADSKSAALRGVRVQIPPSAPGSLFCFHY